MPVDTEFLKRTLENCFENKVEVRRLFDFLREVMSSESQQQALSGFLNKWELSLPKSMRGMMVVSYVGTWPPACLSSKQLQHQKPWPEYARGYAPSFQECDNYARPDYQPLNFKELISLAFWKELYEKFGNKIVSYLFDKCGILFEVEEGLYLLVAWPKCIIYNKFSPERKFTVNRATSSLTQADLPHRSINQNPYKVRERKLKTETEKEKENLVTQKKVKRRKRVVRFSEENEEHEPKAKRIKLADNLNCSQRWIRAKPAVLNNIIDRRNAQRKAFKIGAEDSSVGDLNYVWVQKDIAFKPTDKTFIIKQTLKLKSSKPKVPRTWDGFKLPDNLRTLANSKELVDIHIYIISETLAKDVGIRIKPKGRQRKKGPHNCTSVTNPVLNLPATSVPESVTAANKSVNPILEERKLENIQQNSSLNTILRQPTDKTDQPNLTQQSHNIPRIKPYFPSCTLSVVSCLYNSSSWSKWPSSHSLSKASMLYAQDDKTASIRVLVDDILKTPTCSLSATQHLNQSISGNWNAGDILNPVNKIILDIIQSHSRFKDIHKLQKNCITYWHKKSLDKQEKKRKSKRGRGWEKRSEEVKETKVSNKQPDASGSNQAHNSIQIVDLSTQTSVVSVPVLCIEQSAKIPLKSTDVVDRAPVVSRMKSVDKCIQVDTADLEKISNAKCKSRRKKFDLLRKCSGDTIKKRSYNKLNHHVPYNCVMQSVKQIMHIMKVDQLLGSKRNIRGFFKFARKAVILGGIKSSLHLRELLAMIKPGDMPITHVTDSELAIDIFTAKLLTWLFNEYVLVLLKTSFYITECNYSRMQLMFYLREDWISSSQKMKSHLVEKGALQALPNNQSQLRPNVILRYIPKRNNTLRTLVSVKKSPMSLTKDEGAKVNGYLHYIDSKINKSRTYLPTTLQYVWRKFISEWRATGSPKLYYLRMDIRDAYPSVSHDKLLNILESATIDVGHKLIRKRIVLLGNSGVKRARTAIFDQQNRQSWHSGIHVRPCIAMVLEHNMEDLKSQDILECIKSHIMTKNIVKSGKNIYEFNYGLPQGWSQSPILCNIYYGYIDTKHYLPYLESYGRLFLRLVDDYLFVSPDANEVFNLMQLMKIAGGNHNIKLNEEKSETNIYVSSNLATSDSNCAQVTFCGWAFCITCGHVSRDFQKYAGQDFCSTISFKMPNYVTSPEQFLRLRGTLIVPARVKPILLDPSINCHKRIITTVFEASIILCFRLYAMCKVIYPNLGALEEEERAQSIMSCINLCCTRLAKYAARNAEYRGPTFSSQQKVSCDATSICCGSQRQKNNSLSCQSRLAHSTATQTKLLGVDALKYTAFYGFRMKLKKHRSVFKKILFLLNESFFKLEWTLGDQYCNKIKEIVGTGMPEWSLKILI